MRSKLLKARPHSFFSTSTPQHDERSMSFSLPSLLSPQPYFSCRSCSLQVPETESSSAVSPSTVPAVTAAPASASAPAPPAEPLSSPKPPPSKAARPSDERPSFRTSLTPASEGSANPASPANPAMPRTPTSGGVNGQTSSQPSASTVSLSPQFPHRMNSTIRTVSDSEEKQRSSGEDSSSEGTQSHATSRNSALSSSINSMSSEGSQNYTQSMDSGFGKSPYLGGETPKTLRSRPSMADIPQRESSISKTGSAATLGSYGADPGGGGAAAAAAGQTPNEMSLSNGEAHLSGSWDNSVGKAGLGKTGRVINRLVSDNEALKRDIKIEQLKAEESRQTARLLEDKLERTISEYESRLLEANVTKTLLARKERQVESLQATIELERSRAVAAGDRERVWKEALDEVKAKAKREVDEATNYAMLMEGRYNAISSHWKDQGTEVKQLIARMSAEIAELNQERRRDDEKIITLNSICDQQDHNIRKITEEKEAIERQHEEYKAEQERALKGIKTDGKQREEEQEAMLEECRETLNKLKWALNVKNTIPWAE
ncbi:hypothetical protein QBC42DRAFT_325150 [Cladorrhinum samala]|uniref:SWI5-dependent HO expression protein 3 n=1 Tax=Cladorrhinum samala TaxID=585594 RepID=A0AAV9HT32_9PEZI|nr:hypothetical protein QBC42DRAFT_325150 [Cladorrhinum samala]